MDSLSAYAKGVANRGREQMVFDWHKAAKLIKEKKPRVASAGLRSDWEWTGGIIFQNGNIVTDKYTYLSSTWATPELDLDGEVVDCYKMQSEVPNWNENSKWPESAIAILDAKEV